MEGSRDTCTTNRKIRKPLMERKRRARINRSLDELQHLLTENELTSKGAKLEKADILEMTVQYLRQVKQEEWSREIRENLENALLERYLLGFEKCAEEVEILVTEIPGLDFRSKREVLRNLKNFLEKVKTRQNRRLTEGKENEVPGRGCWGPPSKIPISDVFLLVSPPSPAAGADGGVKSEGSFTMWRPW